MTSTDNRTILLVEDEAILAMSEKMSLEKYGYTVITVNTGEKAIEAMKTSSRISIILMDIDLGKGIDGTEAASMILEDHDIPIIFLSSHCEREIVEKAEKITSYGYVEKNSSITVLDASIKMAFKLFEAKNVYKDTFIFSINGLCIHKMLYDETSNQYDFEYIHVNPEFEKQTGLTAEMVTGRTIRQLYSYNKVDAIITLYKGVMESGVPVRKETFFETIDRWFLISVFPMHDKLLTVAMQNITEQKSTMEKLRQSEEEHRRLFMTMSPGVVYQSAEGSIISANPSAERMLGLTIDQMNGKTSMDPRWKMLDEQGQEVPGSEHPAMQSLSTGEKVGPIDRAVFIPEKNEYVWLSITAIPLFDPGDSKPYQVFTTFDDITGRKRNERLLAEKEALFRGLFDNMTSGSAVYEVRNDGSKGKDYIIRYFNQKGRELEGKKLEEVVGKSLFDLRPTIDDYGLIGAMKQVWETGISAYFPVKIYQDERFSNYYENHIFKLPSGHIATIYNDVTKDKNQEEALRASVEELQQANEELQAANEEMQVQNEELQYTYEAIRKAEVALRESEEKFRRIVESSPVAMYFYHLEGDGRLILTGANPSADRIIGIRHTELIGKTIEEAFPLLASTPIPQMYRMVASGEAGNQSFEIPYTDDRFTGFYDVTVYQTNTNTIAVDFTDITERKLAEADMKKLLAEKELILKEVNHRIKNNMNAMRSLFSLQGQRTNDAAAAGVLEDASNRMQSMEILYDQLYQAASFSELSIAAYVSPLVDAVIGNFPQGNLVRLEQHIDDFILDAKRLQPLGMIINELLTNIMKYAFPDKSTGQITVSVQRSKGLITLAVQDNGTGIPAGIDFENSTGFGLTLVKALAEQLDGTIRIERLGGTRVVLEFEQ